MASIGTLLSFFDMFWESSMFGRCLFETVEKYFVAIIIVKTQNTKLSNVLQSFTDFALGNSSKDPLWKITVWLWCRSFLKWFQIHMFYPLHKLYSVHCTLNAEHHTLNTVGTVFSTIFIIDVRIEQSISRWDCLFYSSGCITVLMLLLAINSHVDFCQAIGQNMSQNLKISIIRWIKMTALKWITCD